MTISSSSSSSPPMKIRRFSHSFAVALLLLAAVAFYQQPPSVEAWCPGGCVHWSQPCSGVRLDGYCGGGHDIRSILIFFWATPHPCFIRSVSVALDAAFRTPSAERSEQQWRLGAGPPRSGDHRLQHRMKTVQSHHLQKHLTLRWLRPSLRPTRVTTATKTMPMPIILHLKAALLQLGAIVRNVGGRSLRP